MAQSWGNKTEIRKWAKEVRSKLDMKALSKRLVKKLKQTTEYKNAKNIMIFYPLKDEVDLIELMNDNSKTFYLPKIDGENLLCCKFDKNTELCESCFHTKEPDSDQVTFNPPDLVIVPALACDKNNFRLGYGGGFYDRFLSKTKTVKLVCIPEQFLLDTVYPEEFDIPVDKIITA